VAKTDVQHGQLLAVADRRRVIGHADAFLDVSRFPALNSITYHGQVFPC